MSSPNVIRAAIKARLETVPGIGVVHGYSRYARRSADMVGFYQDGDGGPIRGWHIRRPRRTQTAGRDGRGGGSNTPRSVVNQWLMEGFLSLQDGDASERAFDELLEAIVLAFDDDDTLGGVVISCTTDQAAGVQVDVNEHAMFGSVLCHRAKLILHTRHYQ